MIQISSPIRGILFVAAIALVLHLSFEVSAQDEDKITIDSSLVVLNATITDKRGKPVMNLKQEDIRILEDGVEQEIAFFESFESPFAATLLIDTSGSMESRVTLARAAAIKFLETMRGFDFAALYHFNSRVELIQDFTNLKHLPFPAYNLKANGFTKLNDAVYIAAEALKNRPEKRRAIIVLSDGADTRSRHSQEKALRAAMDADATIYTVDMADNTKRNVRNFFNRKILKNFSDKTGGTYVSTPGGRAMRDAFREIATELGSQITLGYHPKNKKRDGKWRSIKLVVNQSNLNIRTREGYNAPKQ